MDYPVKHHHKRKRKHNRSKNTKKAVSFDTAVPQDTITELGVRTFDEAMNEIELTKQTDDQNSSFKNSEYEKIEQNCDIQTPSNPDRNDPYPKLSTTTTLAMQRRVRKNLRRISSNIRRKKMITWMFIFSFCVSFSKRNI